MRLAEEPGFRGRNDRNIDTKYFILLNRTVFVTPLNKMARLITVHRQQYFMNFLSH